MPLKVDWATETPHSSMGVSIYGFVIGYHQECWKLRRWGQLGGSKSLECVLGGYVLLMDALGTQEVTSCALLMCSSIVTFHLITAHKQWSQLNANCNIWNYKPKYTDLLSALLNRQPLSSTMLEERMIKNRERSKHPEAAITSIGLFGLLGSDKVTLTWVRDDCPTVFPYFMAPHQSRKEGWMRKGSAVEGRRPAW